MISDFFEKLKVATTWHNAKILSCLTVACCIYYHGFTNSKDRTCTESVLQADPKVLNSSCSLINYDHSNIGRCSSAGPINMAFIGDTYALKIKDTLKNLLHNGSATNTQSTIEYYSKNSIDKTIKEELRLLRLRQNEVSTNTVPPDLVIIAFANILKLPYDQKIADEIYKNLTSITFQLNLLSQSTRTFWIFPRLIDENKHILQSSPISSSINEYKHIFTELLKGTRITLWDTSDPIMVQLQQFSITNTQYESQILLNLLCNQFQPLSSIKLCCQFIAESQNTFYLVISLLLIGISLPFLIPLKLHKIRNCVEKETDLILNNFRLQILGKIQDPAEKELPVVVKKPIPPTKRSTPYLAIFIKCIIIFGYFYMCDRTALFPKGEKVWSTLEFSLPIISCVILGFAFRGESKNDQILNREITDEWKGWMQIFILIYHITGASSILPIYMHIRILVSAYLFMTGFGNFSYYWNGGDMTFRRYCQVMMRMNLLTIILCLVMQRPYQFYYFVPLVSFWFSLLYVLLLTPPKLKKSLEDDSKIKIPSSTDAIFVILKFVILFVVISALSFSKPVFDAIFMFPAWKFLFVLPGREDSEWWFRWQLDRYSILYGAGFSLTNQIIFSSRENGEKQVSVMFPWIKTVCFCILGILLVSSYSLVFTICSSKTSCNVLHPYGVFIPIMGYILIRNVSPLVRKYHSKILFAAGKISLELFICQYHIWLSADTNGRLILIPGLPLVNIVVTSFIFVCIAHEVNDFTGHITRILIPEDTVKICLNLFIFLTLVAVLAMTVS